MSPKGDLGGFNLDLYANQNLRDEISRKYTGSFDFTS